MIAIALLSVAATISAPRSLTVTASTPAYEPAGDEHVPAGYHAVGWMFTFRRKTFVGSYRFLSATSRSYLAAP